MKRYRTQIIVMAGVLAGLHVILSRFCSVNAWNLKIGFSIIPVFAAAYLHGPLFAGAVGAVGDFVGAVLFPIGAYFPGFTATCFLTGVVLGIFLRKKQTLPRVLFAVLINELVFGLLLNTFWISVLYGSAFLPLLTVRVVQCGIMIPVNVILISAISKCLIHIRKKQFCSRKEAV